MTLLFWNSASEEYFVENVINLDSHVLVTVSGVGDTRSFLRNMKEQYKHDHEAEERFSALEVSEWAGKYLSSHNDKDPSAKVLIAVWDDEKMRAGVFIMDANGQRSIKKWGATGSGSRVVPCFFKIGQAPFPFDYLVVFVNFFSHPDLLVLLCNSFDKKGYDEAAVYVKWVIDATVSVLAFLKRTGSSDIETCGYISGYYVGANDLKRVFHNEPFTPARVFDNKPSTPAL
ncbi:OLC1v1006576C2 [Oldenlandia corymbosa var. corymbosa]|uniref:OLC1v1006576C2 n=1 Tax=Oldenlandia corymbosa var. corymbosa TaxID=529605 RepID=A0AAV1DHV7_OLDCO|nr:OLC1v1006576C2 [Oldenlandia corymbosa var. corymbosa]